MLLIVKKNFEIADRKGATFVTQVKGNQRKLKQNIRKHVDFNHGIAFMRNHIQKQHGRIEKRSYELFDAKLILKDLPEWHRIRAIVRVHRQGTRKGKAYDHVSYYASNKLLPIKDLKEAIERQWGIENHLHYVKDTAMLEDAAQRRCSPFNFATCISFALNILRHGKVDCIKGKLYENSLNVLEMFSCIQNL